MVSVRWVQGHWRIEADGYKNTQVQQKRLILVVVESSKPVNLKTEKIIFECPIVFSCPFLLIIMLFHELLK